jgi:hypothetical protein
VHTRDDNNAKYRILKALKHSQSTFVNVADDSTVEALRNRYGNRDLVISTCFYTVSDLSAPRIYPLYFRIVSNDQEETRKSALEAVFYLADNFQIPQDQAEIIYCGGGTAYNGENDNNIGSLNIRDTGSKNAGDNNDNKYLNASRVDNIGNDDIITGGSIGIYNNKDNADSELSIAGRSGGNKTNTVPAEMIIIVQPLVFDGQPTPFMPALNYHLARQLINDGLNNIDIDVYQRDYCISLPNSIRDGNFVIPLPFKELLNLDISAIAKLSKQPRAEDSLILPQRIPEAAEWFAETLAEFEKMLRRQQQLRKAMLEKGWEISPCIERMQKLCLYDDIRLEAYRAMAQYYAWAGANPSEIRRRIQESDRRNPIKDYQRLGLIITFATENPAFVGCDHPLLRRFCAAGRCFMAELINEYQNPSLFELEGK